MRQIIDIKVLETLLSKKQNLIPFFLVVLGDYNIF